MTDSQHNTNAPKPLPGSTFVRPGIDDRPDYDNALSDADKAALERLSMWGKAKTPESSAEQTSAQSARMAASGSPLASAAASALDSPAPDMASAYLDMRDPVVAADGETPNAQQLKRFNLGFALAALLTGLPWVALNAIVVPAVVARLVGIGSTTRTVSTVAPVVPLAIIVALGSLVSLITTALVSVLSDRTRTAHGRRTPWIIAGGVVAAIVTLILTAVESVSEFGFFWLIMQFAYAMIAVPVTASIAERIPDKYRPSIERTHGIAVVVGQALGLVLGAFGIALDFGPATFIIAALFLVAAVVTVLVLPAEPSSENQGHQRFDMSQVAEQFALPSSPRFARVCLARVFMMTSISLVGVFLWYLVRYWLHGSDASAATGTWQSFTVIAMIAVGLLVALLIATLIAPSVSARLSDHAFAPALAMLCVVCALGLAVAWVFAVWTGDTTRAAGLIIAAIVCAFVFGLYDSLGMALAVTSLPNPRDAGHDIGIYAMTSAVGVALAALIGAAVISLFGYAALFAAAAIVALIAAIIVATAR